MDIILIECLVTKCGHKYCGKCINQWLEKIVFVPIVEHLLTEGTFGRKYLYL